VNQGKIGGDSRLVYRVRGTNKFVSAGLKDQYETDELHVDVNIVNGHELDTRAFTQWRPDYADAEFILEDWKIYLRLKAGENGQTLFQRCEPG
jgi:leucyl-tRNA synthetase